MLAVRFGRSQWPRGLKVWVCNRSLSGIAGLNPAGAWMSELCTSIVKQRSLRRADHSARGFLPSVCVCVSLSVIKGHCREGSGPLGCRAMKKIKKIISERHVSRQTLAFQLPPCSAEVQERVQPYLYSASGPLWSLLGRTLPYPHSKWLIGRP